MCDSTSNFYSENLCSATGITAIFSCPGRFEKLADRPCSGMTGRSLEYILEKILFNGKRLNRSLVGINNAWSKVEFFAKTNRSEADDFEILNSSNIDRLKNELKNTKIAIAFGDKALLALNAVKNVGRSDLHIVNAIHLSPRRINTCIKKDVFGNVLKKGAKGNFKKRLSVVANDIKRASGGLFV